MSLEPIGLATIFVGLCCLALGHYAASTALVVATLFAAAAAILVGSANIQPAHLLLAFVATAVFRNRREAADAIRAISPPQPGFWLMCLVIYGVFSAVLFPRLLAGSTQIVPLGVSEYANTGSTVPLGPVSSNFTQSVYLAADFICFAMIVAVASTYRGFAAMAAALVAFAALNVMFALLDIVTYSTNTGEILNFMRNAQYTLHHEEEVTGLKRIVGSFPEASSFARATLGALGFTGTMWLCGHRPALTGPLAVISLLLVVLSTSSTGLAGTGPLLLILYATALIRGGFHPARPYSSIALLCAPLLAVGVILALLLNDAAAERVHDYFDTLIFAKSTTDSGMERESWNAAGLQNFFDSDGLGVGLGTIRTSSLPIALLSNVGVPGTIFYVLFLASIFLRRRGKPWTFTSDVRLAARNACLGLIIGDIFAAPSVEQGLLFYVFAGMACAEPERSALPDEATT